MMQMGAIPLRPIARAAGGLLLTCALAGAATGGFAQSVASRAAPPPEWTGESGSSGHPLMQAAAIRKAAANFESCLEELWPLAAKRNISRASFDKYVRGL